MALLNPPEILPHLMEVIHRCLRGAERQAMERETLIRLLAPSSLGQGDAGQPGSRALSRTLIACRMIGLLVEERPGSDGQVMVYLNAAVRADGRDGRGGRQFRSALRMLVLDEVLNGELWEESDGGPSQEGARDLTRALSWFLAQDVFGPPLWYEDTEASRSVDRLQSRQLATADRVIVNDTRWQSFARWAPYLGFARPVVLRERDYLMPDPTPAVAEAVAAIAGDDVAGTVDLRSFLDRLAAILPVVDGGRYRRAVEERMIAPPWSRALPQGALSSSLATALLRLQDLVVLELVNKADYPQKMLFPDEAGQFTPYSHVTITNSGGFYDRDR